MNSKPWSNLHAQVHQELRNRNLLPVGTSLIAAVSGGQDSIALLRLLIDLQPKWHWRLRVVHCDHRWRSDSAENAAFVQALCQRWQVPCQVVVAETIPPSEADARHWRYAILCTLAAQNRCTHIATGHTATDRAETLLYNLLRGSGTDGLQALAWQRNLSRHDPEGHDPEGYDPEGYDPEGHDPQITAPEIRVVRPLLALTRQDTADFCQQFNLPLWLDSTNQDTTYTRNRLRLEVIPYLAKQVNRQVEANLAQTAEILTAEVALLEQMSQDLYAAAVRQTAAPPTWRIHRLAFNEAPLALQRRVMRQVLQQAMTAPVNFNHIEKLVALGAAPNRTQTDPFPGGWLARVEAEWIVLFSAAQRELS